MSVTSDGAVHHCHHYYRGADSCTDIQWTDPTAGELRVYSDTFDCDKEKFAVPSEMKPSTVRSQTPRIKGFPRIPDPIYFSDINLSETVLSCLTCRRRAQ